MAVKKAVKRKSAGLKTSGKLKKGFKFAKGGKIIKVSTKIKSYIKTSKPSAKRYKKGGYVVGDKVKMFKDEPILTITKVNHFSDKKNTYNLKSNDNTINRKNISETKINRKK